MSEHGWLPAALGVLALVTAACASPAAPGVASALQPSSTPAGPQKILFVGDSNIYFNLGHAYHFEKLVASADPPPAIDADDLTSSGTPLKALWEGSATLDLGLGGTPTRDVKEVVASGDYDVLVLDIQIMSHEGAPPGYSLETQQQYAETFVRAAEDAGSDAALYMLWPINPMFGVESAATFDETVQWVGDMGRELGVPVAPVALAWQRAIAERSDLALYAGTEHPTIHGTYLGVCVVYATLLNQTPEGLSYWPEEDGVTEEEARFLQRIAWETVEEYRAQR